MPSDKVTADDDYENQREAESLVKSVLDFGVWHIPLWVSGT